VRAIVAALADVSVTRATLLVVPCCLDEGNRLWDLRDDPRLVDWLRRSERTGSEIVQHGLTHRAPGPPPPGMRNALMHRWFSRGSAEFAHLDGPRADERLGAGRRVLRACGLTAAGFIAPAWQQSRAAIAAVRRAGFAFTAFFDRVVPLNGARAVSAPVLTFAAPSRVVDLGKRGVMRCVEAASRASELLRVALHPADVHAPGLLSHVVARIRALLHHRQQVTYAEWLPGRALLPGGP
jgi:predicted deacetylase